MERAGGALLPPSRAGGTAGPPRERVGVAGGQPASLTLPRAERRLDLEKFRRPTFHP